MLSLRRLVTTSRILRFPATSGVWQCAPPSLNGFKTWTSALGWPSADKSRNTDTNIEPTTMASDHPLAGRMNSVQELVNDDPLSWDVVWKKGLTRWDAGEVQPPLKHLIEGGEVPFPKGGKALVPGCGRGYDTVYLAATLGHNTVGQDVSVTGIEAAKEFVQSKVGNTDLASKISFSTDDFFKYKVPDDQKYDLIYDYTFFVAIPPSRRPEWGSQINALIKPGGYLITLMFPHGTSPFKDGPPYYSTFSSYEEVLGSGWEVVYNKVPDDATLNEVHKGKDRMVVWKRTSGKL